MRQDAPSTAIAPVRTIAIRRHGMYIPRPCGSSENIPVPACSGPFLPERLVLTPLPGSGHRKLRTAPPDIAFPAPLSLWEWQRSAGLSLSTLPKEIVEEELNQSPALDLRFPSRPPLGIQRRCPPARAGPHQPHRRRRQAGPMPSAASRSLSAMTPHGGSAFSRSKDSTTARTAG